MEEDKETEDVKLLKAIIINLRNEQSSLKKILKIRSEEYQNEIQQLNQKNHEMEQNYLEIMTSLEKKLNAETRKFNSTIIKNEKNYRLELEKKEKSFKAELGFQNLMNENLRFKIQNFKNENK